MGNNIKIGNNVLELTIDVFKFFKDGIYNVYCPALNLVGCAYKKEDADADFSEVLKLYFEDVISNNTLERDLEAHGWKKMKQPEESVSKL